MKHLILIASLALSGAAAHADYWSDLVDMCVRYSPATHPPCNKDNGAKMIADEVVRSCKFDDSVNECTSEAVELCKQYSTATHPPCNASNGLEMVLDEVVRVAPNYP